MQQVLDDLLCQRYPEIFRDRHGDKFETSMCWGFCCGDGWFAILEELCNAIATQVEGGTMPPVVATQVKEKLGQLHFHISGHFKPAENPEAHRLIARAQKRAELTCQECGGTIELIGAKRCCVACKWSAPSMVDLDATVRSQMSEYDGHQ
jgi:hypothetical protein